MTKKQQQIIKEIRKEMFGERRRFPDTHIENGKIYLTYLDDWKEFNLEKASAFICIDKENNFTLSPDYDPWDLNFNLNTIIKLNKKFWAIEKRKAIKEAKENK